MMKWWQLWCARRRTARATRSIADAESAHARGDVSSALCALEHAVACTPNDPAIYDAVIALHTAWTAEWTEEDFTRSLDWAMRAQELREPGARVARGLLTGALTPSPLIGLTGGIGCGKSFVLECFAGLGAATISSDAIVHELYASDAALVHEMAEIFGADILHTDGSLDRRALGARVFRDSAARSTLEALVHPRVRATITHNIAQAQLTTPPAIVVEIPLLYEVYGAEDFDQIIVVACDPATQLARVQKKFGLDVTDAQARIDAQMPLAEKCARADYVIHTDGTKEETAAQIHALWPELPRTRKL